MWKSALFGRAAFTITIGFAQALLTASAAWGAGPVIQWGGFYGEQAPPPPSVDGTAGLATAIAAGWTHSYAIQAGTSAVVCWGEDQFGETIPPPSVDGTSGTASAIAAGV